eukprot:TRINITY_DN18902_c0_g6_i1.p1 TRINITY_DN18902_c0_g6~~TRINITY_DN18902_c0_g6_i1.p1  ORF type:complete len:190 (+),score=32.60 TRINITY_DN18902_c0_g6_i1:82-651(+)
MSPSAASAVLGSLCTHVPAASCVQECFAGSRPWQQQGPPSGRSLGSSRLSSRQGKCQRGFCLQTLRREGKRRSVRVEAKGSESGGVSGSEDVKDPWLEKLPDKSSPLYTHSLPSIEAWLHHLEFKQLKDDPAMWRIERPDWHAELAMDVTDLGVRYLKSGPGNLSRDVERKFSYALSRQDLENAILGGP